MNLSFQEYLPSIMKFLTGKLIFKNKFENRFSINIPSPCISRYRVLTVLSEFDGSHLHFLTDQFLYRFVADCLFNKKVCSLFETA